MKKGLAIWMVTFSCLQVVAQSDGPSFIRVSGTVRDTADAALDAATVRMVVGTDTLTELSAGGGHFLFPRVKEKKFTILVTMSGYSALSQQYRLPAGKQGYVLEALTLHQAYGELEPAIVTRIRPVVIQGDTVSYNTAAFPVRDGSEVEDILKRLPGIEVDINGNVIVQGKLVSKVLVNGKEFFGSDVLLAIQNLPADIVEKLQVIDDYGDKARLTDVKSGDPEKVLNIVLKPNKRNGEFGQFHTAIGDQSKYDGGAFANSFKADRQLSAIGSVSNNNPNGSDLATHAGLNYADQWVPQWGGAFNINRTSESPHTAETTSSTSFFPGEVLQQLSSSENSSVGNNYTIDGRLTFKPDGSSTVRLTFNGYVSQSNNRGSAQFNDIQRDSGFAKTTTGQSVNTANVLGRSVSSSLYYEHSSTKTKERFSVDAIMTYATGSQFGEEQSIAEVVLDSGLTNSNVHYLTKTLSANLELASTANYFKPLGRRTFLEIGYRVHLTAASNNVNTQAPDSATGIASIIDSLSQNMFSRALSQSLHAGFTGKIRQFDISATLAAEPGQETGTINKKESAIAFHYFAILPSLNVSWDLASGRRLYFQISSRPTLPTIQELSPLTNVSNPQYPVVGNPNLRPSYTNGISLRYQKHSLQPTRYFGFSAGLNFNETNHSIIQNSITPKDSSQVVQTTTWANSGNSYLLAANYQIALPAIFGKSVRVNVNGSMGTSQTTTMVNSLPFGTQILIWSQSIQLQMIIPNLVETDLAGSYGQTNSAYSGASSLPGSFRAATINWDCRWYFLRHWILNYQLNQSYISSGSRLETGPAILGASIQRQFLAHNLATITISGYNLFDQLALGTQSASSNTLVLTKPILTGRYFLVGVVIKPRRFR